MLSTFIPEHISIFEVDLRATQNVRRRAMGAARNVTSIPPRFGNREFARGLARGAGLRSAGRTVFVAEGVLIYLDGDRGETIFADITELTGRVRIIATIVTPDARGQVRPHTQRRIVDLCMRLLGERFRWGGRATQRLLREVDPVSELAANRELGDEWQRHQLDDLVPEEKP